MLTSVFEDVEILRKLLTIGSGSQLLVVFAFLSAFLLVGPVASIRLLIPQIRFFI